MKHGRLLSVVLTLAMLFSLVPCMSLAARAEGGVDVTAADVTCRAYPCPGAYEADEVMGPPAEVVDITLEDALAFGAAVRCPTPYWVVVYALEDGAYLWVSNGVEDETDDLGGFYDGWSDWSVLVEEALPFCDDPAMEATLYVSQGLAGEFSVDTDAFVDGEALGLAEGLSPEFAAEPEPEQFAEEPEAVEEAEFVEEPEAIAETDSVEEVESVEEPESIEESESVEAAETVESESIEESESVEEAEPVEEPEEIVDGEAVIETEEPAEAGPAVTGVTLNRTTLATSVDRGTLPLVATVSPENADQTVVWSSDDESVVTVENGVVTSLAVGTATVTATATNGTPEDPSDDKSASCVVTVSKVKSFELRGNEISYIGSDSGFTARCIARHSDGNSNEVAMFYSVKEKVFIFDPEIENAFPPCLFVTKDDHIDFNEPVRKISVMWNAQTSEGAILEVYGKNSPYTFNTSAIELYSANPADRGEKLGEIIYDGESAVGEFLIEGNYPYVGLRPAEGSVLYMDCFALAYDVTGIEILDRLGNDPVETLNLVTGGSAEKLMTKLYPYDTDYADKTVICESSDPSVATASLEYSGEGRIVRLVVTPVSAGTATITVTATNGTPYPSDDKSDTCIVTVTHEHSFTYSSDGDTITAACSKPGCDLPDGKISIRLLPPADLTYDGSAKRATIEGAEAFSAATGNTVSESEIKYFRSYTLPDAPIDAGDYRASYTLPSSKTMSVNFTVVPASGSLSYAETSVRKAVGDAAFTNPLTLVGDGAVSYSSDKASVATVDASTGEVTIVGSGTATITATVTDGANYAYAQKTASYTVNVGSQDMDLSVSIDDWTYGETPSEPTVTGNVGGGAVSYTYKAKDADDSAYSSTVPTNAGEYTVKATAAASGSYNEATATADFKINKAVARIYFEQSTVNATYDDEPFTIQPINTGDGRVVYAYGDPDVCEVHTYTGEVRIHGSGVTTVYAHAMEGVNYTYPDYFASYTLNVAKGNYNLIVSLADWTYGDAPNRPSVNIYGPTIVYTYAVKGTTEFTEDVPTNAGEYTIKAFLAESDDYNEVTATADFRINKAAGTIGFESAAVDKRFGDEPFTVTVTNTGDGAVSYASDKADVATVDASTGKVTIIGSGTATITATVTDGANYAYLHKTASYTVNVDTIGMDLSVSIADWTYGETPSTPSVTGNVGGGAVTYTYAVKGSTDFAADVPTNAGEYTVKATAAASGSYNEATATADFKINKAAGTISFESANVDKSFGDEPFTVTAANTGDGAVTYASNNTDVATVDANTGKVTIIGSGTATITATVTDGANYAYLQKTASYTVNVGSQDMDLSVSIADWTYGETPSTPSVSGNVGGGAVTYTYAVKGSTDFAADVPTNAGEYTVKATAAASGSYNEATATADFKINKAAGTIGFESAAVDKRFGDEPFTVTVTNTGDGAVSYASDKADVATVDASTGKVTIIGSGTATITATVTDGANYAYAQKTASYTVNVDTIGMDLSVSIADWTYGETPSAPSVTGNVGGGAVTYTYAVKGSTDFAADVPTNAGEYTVKATAAASGSYNEATATADFTINKAAGSIRFESANVDKRFGEEPFTVTVTNTGDGAVTYASNNTDVATVDANTGKVTIIGSGTATITATVTDGANYAYAQKTASYTLNVASTVRHYEYQLVSVAGVTDDASHAWTKGSDKDLVITAKQSIEPDDSFTHYDHTEIDGKTVDASARKGSTIVTVKAAELQKLAVGEHTVSVVFDDGRVDVKLTVKEAPTPSAPPAKTTPSAPPTGDDSSVALWTALFVLSALGLAAAMPSVRRRKENT